VVFFLVQFFLSIAHSRLLKIVSGCFVLAFLALFFYHQHAVKKIEINRESYVNKKPNVIIFMYCSMRNDFFDGGKNFKAFSKNSITFDNAYTPVARSGSSTYALLSGLYPYHSGYFFNLNEGDPSVKFKNLFTFDLEKEGYQTVFLTNINLFRRVDQKINWGFNLIDASPHNIFSFILTKISDIPLTNFFSRMAIMRSVFPYFYNNVEATVQYSPHNFTSRLQHILKYKLKQKPVFLLINDEMMHFPYNIPNTPAFTYKENVVRYLKLFQIEDSYFQKEMQILKQGGLLKNAVVIVMSDHGESFGNKLPTNDPLLVYGHGNSAFSQAEFNIPFVFHFYGKHFQVLQPQKINSPVSTLDVVPTLSALLHINIKKTDGVSLLSTIEGKHKLNNDRVLFRQSGLTFLIKLDKNVDKLAVSYIKSYHISGHGEVYLRKIVIDREKSRIQYAALFKNFLLVYIPKEAVVAPKMPLVKPAYFLVNTKTGRMLIFQHSDLDTNLMLKINSKKLFSIHFSLKSVNDIKMMQQALDAYIKKSIAS